MYTVYSVLMIDLTLFFSSFSWYLCGIHVCCCCLLCTHIVAIGHGSLKKFWPTMVISCVPRSAGSSNVSCKKTLSVTCLVFPLRIYPATLPEHQYTWDRIIRLEARFIQLLRIRCPFLLGFHQLKKKKKNIRLK